MTKAARQISSASPKTVGLLARWLLPSIGGLSVLLVLQLLITNSWRFLLDSDTGWHVRTGELILQNRAVPHQDPFSHTMPDASWFAWEWLTEALMAALHGWRGLAGVVGGAIFVLLASFALLYALMIRRGADPVVACVVTVFGAIAGIVGWLARPHLVSILMMALWYAMVESFRRRRSRWIYGVPPLIALWANLHGAFVVTLVVLGVYAAGELLESVWRGEWSKRETPAVLKTYLIVGVLSALAVAATPYGLKLYGHLWRYLTDTPLLSTIQEFQSPDFHSINGKLIEILLLLGAVAAINALRQRRVVETALLLLWGHMTLQSERHVTLAVVILAPIIAEQLSNLAAEWIDWAAQGRETRSKALRAARDWYRSVMAINRQLTGASCYAAALVIVIAAASTGLADKLLSPRFDENRFPAAAADFVLQHRPTGRMFSHDQYGGYLIYRLYPDFKVFVDGRSDFYRQGSVLEETDRIRLVKNDWQQLLDKRSVDWMLLKRDEPLAQIAVLSGNWSSIYEDAISQVLIRNKNNRPPNPAPPGASTGQRNTSEFHPHSRLLAETLEGDFMTLRKISRSLRKPAVAVVVIAALGVGAVTAVPSVRQQLAANFNSGANLFLFNDDLGDTGSGKKDNSFKRVFGAPFRMVSRLFKRKDDGFAMKKPSDKEIERMKVIPVNRSRTGSDQIADAADGTTTETTTAELAAQTLFDEAVTLHDSGRLDVSIEKLVAATVLQPNFSEAYNLLGVCYDERGQYTAAQEEYKKALKIESNNARFLNNAGYSYYLAGDYGNSIKHYSRGLKITPNDRRMHNNIGLAYGRKGDYDKAKQHFSIAVGEIGANLNLGYIYSQQGKYDDAIKHYETALRLKPDSLPAMSNLAQLYDRAGRLREAAVLYEQYKKLSAAEKDKDQVADKDPQ
ncbi:MAG TPA: tetratricopeptide repeat protein [Blastocatellia bacterium]|nr:tetratricopeptide repeat protein [Blastocatellia bacterium]HMV83880.1 tetratricopeptide repeat protein [Blastocatellia bacterium]HMY71429.1 tetratricopeptide repeat protein [Blastocatellia bacterium]HMZ17178.1 tetratricopeptide repeat protein [Blastocatellia bacterium]HNG31871.1 tetratricopeptide repeat protein [Blastocatellia bacterium]